MNVRILKFLSVGLALTAWALVLARPAQAGGGLVGGGTLGGGTPVGTCDNGTSGGTPELNGILAPDDPGGQITVTPAHVQNHTWGEWYPWQSNLPPAWSVVVIPTYFPCGTAQIDAAGKNIDNSEKANPHGGCLRIRHDFTETRKTTIVNGIPSTELTARTRIGETITLIPNVSASSCGANWDGL